MNDLPEIHGAMLLAAHAAMLAAMVAVCAWYALCEDGERAVLNSAKAGRSTADLRAE